MQQQNVPQEETQTHLTFDDLPLPTMTFIMIECTYIHTLWILNLNCISIWIQIKLLLKLFFRTIGYHCGESESACVSAWLRCVCILNFTAAQALAPFHPQQARTHASICTLFLMWAAGLVPLLLHLLSRSFQKVGSTMLQTLMEYVWSNCDIPFSNVKLNRYLTFLPWSQCFRRIPHSSIFFFSFVQRTGFLPI